MSNKWSQLIIAALLGCLSSAMAAEMNPQSAVPVWQKEFAYEGFSCIPQLLAVNGNGQIIVVGTMYNQFDKDIVGRIWQWTLDGKTGERLSDITIKSAKPSDCSTITDFWVTKGLDIADSNEIRLFLDPMTAGGKQGVIRSKHDGIFEKHEIETQASAKGFSAGRMKRFNVDEYFLFGTDRKGGNGVLQKRNNRGNLIWEKQYAYSNWSSISDIDKIKTQGFAITGWSKDKDNKSKTNDAWINIINDDGSVNAEEVFDVNTVDLIQVPQIAVLDNNNIAVVYNRAFNGQATGIEYRIYSADLKLKLKGLIAVSKMDFLSYGMAVIDAGFVVVNDMFESGIQQRALHQYDCDGKKIREIKIAGIGGLGGDQLIVEAKGKMVCIASMKTPVRPPVQTVITALDLSGN